MNASDANSMATDDELVARARDGARQAFAALVLRHQTAACSVAYSVCGDFAASQDVAQEAFISAWNGLPELREPGRFRAWICGISRRIALSEVRRRERRGDRAQAESFAAEPIDRDASPSEGAVAAEESALLWQTLEALPQLYREPLALFYSEQQSIAAVATALELSEDVVKQRLSRGRAMLRDRLADQLEGALVRARPRETFAAGVLAALPPSFAGTSIATGAASAKAGAGAGASGAGLASGAVGLLSVYVLFRYLRSSEVPQEVSRAIRRSAAVAVASSLAFAAFVAWIAATRGDALVATGFSPALALTLAVAAFVSINGILAFATARELRRLPWEKSVLPARARRYASRWKLAGLPLVSVAFGADAATGERSGRARGWLAVGDVAVGAIALGGVAMGPVAIGGAALGVFAIGGATAGLAAVGGIAAGAGAIGGVALGWEFAVGGVAVARDLAVGALAAASERAFGPVAIAPITSDNPAAASEAASRWTALAADLIPSLGWLSLLSIPGLLIALRYLPRNRG